MLEANAPCRWDESEAGAGGDTVSIRIRAFKIPLPRPADDGRDELVSCGWVDCEVSINGIKVVEGNIEDARFIDISKHCNVSSRKSPLFADAAIGHQGRKLPGSAGAHSWTPSCQVSLPVVWVPRTTRSAPAPCCQSCAR